MKTCTLEIHDEVNVKLRDLDLDDRRHLANKYKFELPGARYLPAVRLGRWDGKVSYFSLAGATYINLLPEILEYLDSKGYDVELADTRQYNTKFSFDAVHEQSFAHVAWPAGHPRAGEPIDLRDYQTEVINRFLDNPQSMQCIATGSGKTIMTAVLSQRVEKYGRSVVIVPSKSLVTQTEADYKNLGLDVGVLFGDRKEYTRTHTICTWQSLNSLLKNSKVHKAEVSITEFLEGVVCVIVDECFNGNSKVLTPTGYKPIKDIKAGDEVINYCEKTGNFKTDTVVKQHKNLTKSSKEKMYKLEFDNGSIIEVTGNHKFLTNLGWCRADELTQDHEIINKT